MGPRTFNMSLTPPPDVRSAGQHHDDGPRTWTQPKDYALGMIMAGAGVYRVNGHPFVFEPWDFLLSPPRSRCELDFAGEPPHVFDIFTLHFSDSEEDVYPIPLHAKLGEAGPHYDLQFRRGLNLLHFTRGPLKAVALSVLWMVAETDRPHRKSVYVEEAERMIEARLSQPIRIGSLASELGISQSQLNRLFLADLGRTPLQYVQDRRAAKALELLATTVMPIKQVGAECGFPDLHTFSRFARHRLGASPRVLRTRRGAMRSFKE